MRNGKQGMVGRHRIAGAFVLFFVAHPRHTSSQVERVEPTTLDQRLILSVGGLVKWREAKERQAQRRAPSLDKLQSRDPYI